MPDRWDWWSDRAEAEAREEWSPRDDMPTPDELPDVGARIRPGSGVPFHEAVRARKAAETKGRAS